MTFKCAKCGLPILASAEIVRDSIYHNYCVSPGGERFWGSDSSPPDKPNEGAIIPNKAQVREMINEAIREHNQSVHWERGVR